MNGREIGAANRQGRQGGLMLLVLVLIALPVALGAFRAPPASPGVPPALDRFLDSVRRATPPTARILAVGAPPGLVFYRATVALYPRRVYSAFPTDFAHAGATPATSWPDLLRRARHDGARYVLVWSLPLGASRATRVRWAEGTLVEAPR